MEEDLEKIFAIFFSLLRVFLRHLFIERYHQRSGMVLKSITPNYILSKSTSLPNTASPRPIANVATPLPSQQGRPILQL